MTDQQQGRGFSLMEIMVVLVIIGMIVSIVAVNVFRVDQAARVDIARTNIHALKQGVSMHRLRHGTLPESLEELAGKELDRIPRDPWGTAYVYAKSGDTFEIRSCGPNRAPGGGDDVEEEEK